MTFLIQPIDSGRDGAGRAIMAVCALAALGAFVAGLLANPLPQAIWLHTWQTYGFAVFAGIFALLALRPRWSAGLWELAFFHKAAMAVAALTMTGVPEAPVAGAIDGALAVLIALAYGLSRGWQAWRVRAS